MDARIARHHRVSERTLRRLASFTALAITAQLALAGCSRDRLVYEARLPSTSTPASLEWLGERAEYLDVAVTTAGKELRFFLPAVGAGSEDCLALRGAASADYANAGLLGRLDHGDLRCEPVGLLALQVWRDRRPRGSREPVPRSRSRWSIHHRDADVTLLRGRFGLAGELGWVGGADSIAIVPRGERCDAIADSGNASLEFRHVGPDVLTLLGEDGRCRLLGIARPLP